jgi:hypothetical protein
MLVILLEVVDLSNYFYTHMVYKELWRMDHLHMLVLLQLMKEYQNFQVHVVIEQQFHMDCNCSLVLDMEQQE